MNREFILIPLILWCILILVTAVFEENHSKRIPPDKLRFPRVFGVTGMGIPFPCGWLIYEMLHAEDWEEAKLLYLLCFIPLFALGMSGVWLLLHALNWGIDIKEDRIVYRNVFRRTRIIYFTEITGIQHREPRYGNKNRGRYSRVFDWKDWIMGLIFSKKISSYRIYIGKKSITVDSLVYNYDGSVPRILKAMKKQGIQCPVTTKKTLFG